MTTLTRVPGGRLFTPDLVSFSAEPGCGFLAFLADAALGASLPSSISLAQGLGRGRFLLCDGGFWASPTWRLLQKAVDDLESSSAFSSNVLIVLALDATGRALIKDGILGNVATATVRTDTVSIEDWSISILVGTGQPCLLEAPGDDELRIRGAKKISLSGGSGSLDASLSFIQATKDASKTGGWDSARIVLDGNPIQGSFARLWNPGVSYYFGEAESIRLPLVSPWVNDVRIGLRARLNPFRHWHGDPFCSSIRIVSLTPQEPNPQPQRAFLSTLRSADGTAVYLQPDLGEFVVEQQLHGQSDLVPSGRFGIQVGTKVGRPGAVAPLLLGGAATEFMHVSNDPERREYIDFVPGMNAYSPIEMPGSLKRSLRRPAWLVRAFSGGLDPNLESYRKTAWAKLVPRSGDPVEFVLQPHEAPAYSPTAAKSLNGKSLDGAWGFAKNPIHKDPVLIPLSPAGGIDYSNAAARDAYSFFEQSVLSPVRVRTIGNAPARFLSKARPTTDGWITTPQGFLVRIENETWQEVRIASSLDEDEKTSLELTFHRPKGSPRWVLEDALRHAEVFLVISFPLDPTQYGDVGGVEATVRVRGWKFDLLLPVPPSGLATNVPSKPPVLVVKFGKKSTESLVSEFTAWLFPDSFNKPGSARGVQQRLQNDIAEYKRRATSGNADQKEMYRGFKERILADSWNGVMVFDALPAGFPEQAAGMEAGIAKSNFSAPYFGIDTNRIEPQPDASLKITRSSFFGLVDYEYKKPASLGTRRKSASRPLSDTDPILRGHDENRYGMRVDRLAVQFEDSAIRRFDALLTLRLGSIAGGSFEEKPKSKTSDAFAHDLKIRGRYEVRVRDGHSEDIYTFVNEDIRTLPFGTDNPILESVTVGRVELRSTVTKGAREHVHTRFAVTGKLTFKKTQGDLLSLDELAFSNTAVTLEFDRADGDVSPKFGFEAGAMQAEIRTSRPGGLLERIGAELRGLVWSGRSRADASGSVPAKLPKFPSDFGYFNLKFPGIDLKDGFDFALEVEIALGGLGKLLGLQNKLTGRVLLGWQWNVGGVQMPALGFKLSGVEGKLEIGIQGVVRFIAQEVALLTAGDLPPNQGLTAALALAGAFVEVLGKAVPEKKNVTLMVVFAEGGPAGWLVGGSDYKIGGGFEIPVLILGQRLKWLARSGAAWNARALVVEARKNILNGKLNEDGDSATFDPQSDGLKFKQRLKKLFSESKILYDRGTDWTIATEVKLGEAANVHFVMSDEEQALYGVHVAVPATASFIDIDVLYRKISDEIGLYAIEIAPPAAFRRMDLGAVTVVLGNLGLVIYTNGNWRLELGFPRGRDYSRSFSAELFPFIGFGGAYFGEKSAEVLSLVPRDWNPSYNGHYAYSPVIEFGLAGRFGLGKTIEAGIFRAGVSLTLYATLEGAFGRLARISPPYPAPEPAAVHWRLVGTAGVLFEGYAVVDFAIIKFGFMLAAWAEAGLALEPRAPIIVSVELGVRVSLRLVIARIGIPFDGTLEIAVDLHFETVIHQEWSLGTLNIRPAALQGATLRLANPWAAFQYFAHPQPFKLFLIRDYSLETSSNAGREEAEAKLQIGLLCDTEARPSGDFPAARLLVVAMAWALKPLLDQLYGGDWNKFIVRPNDVQTVLDSLEEKGAKSGPAYSQIASFLAKNLQFVISHPASARPQDGSGTPPKPLDAAYFPTFPELSFALNDRDDFTGHTVGIPGAEVVDAGYEDALRKYFEDAVEQLKERDTKMARKKSAATRPATQLIFEDWFLSVLRAGLRFVIRSVQQKPIHWRDLELAMMTASSETLDSLHKVYAEASTLHLAGLRVPAPGARLQSWAAAHIAGKRPRSRSVDASSMPLIALTGQQVGLAWLDTNWPTKGTLYLKAQSGTQWVLIDASPAVDPVNGTTRPYHWPVDRDIMAALVTDAPSVGNQIQLAKIDQLPPATESPVEVAFGPRFEVGGTDKGALWLLPDDQAPRTSDGGAPPLAATMLMRERPDSLTASGSVQTADVEVDFAPASVVEIILRQAQEVSGHQRAFEIVGGNYRVQRHLEMLAAAIQSGSVEFGLPAQFLRPLSKDSYVKHVDAQAIGKALGVEQAEPGIYRRPQQSIRLHQDEGPWIYRSNLARITQPPVSLRSSAPDEAPYLASLALEQDLPRALTMLKDASVLSSGGYWLVCNRTLGDELSQLFGERAELAVSLLLKSKRAPVAAHQHAWSDAFNAAFVKEAALQGADASPRVPVMRFNRSVLRPVQPHGWIRFRPQRIEGVRSASRRLAASGPRAVQKQEIHDGLLESLAGRFDLLEISTEASAALQAVSPNKIVPFTRADPKDKDRYNVALPIKNFQKGSTGAEPNPYNGVGDRFTVKFGLRDVYGNRLPGYEKRSQGELKYFDRLIPLGELPGVRLSYSFAQAGRGVEVALRFETAVLRRMLQDAYKTPDPGQPHSPAAVIEERLKELKKRFVQCLYQLDPSNKVNAAVKINGPLTGGANAVNADLMRFLTDVRDLIDSVLAKKEPALGLWCDENSAEKPDRVKDALWPIQPQSNLDLTKPRAGLLPSELALRVNLVVLRDSNLVWTDPTTGAAVEGCRQAESKVYPTLDHRDQLSTDAVWGEFTARVEAQYNQFKVARLVDRRASGIGTESTEVYLVPEALVRIESPTDPSQVLSCATKPLRQSLASGQAQVLRPGSQSQVEMFVKDVDFDETMYRFTELLERTLVPISGRSDALGSLARAVHMKSELAQIFKLRLEWLTRVQSGAVNDRTRFVAHDEFLRNLAVAFAPGAFLQVPMNIAPTLYGLDTVFAFGRIEIREARANTDAAAPQVAFSTMVKVPLERRGSYMADVAFYVPQNSYADGKRGEIDGTLSFEPRYIQIRDDEGLAAASDLDVGRSKWLELIRPSSQSWVQNEFKARLPSRSVPRPPKIDEQKAKFTGNLAATPAPSLSWEYSVALTPAESTADGDMLSWTIQYPAPVVGRSAMASQVAATLFDCMASIRQNLESGALSTKPDALELLIREAYRLVDVLQSRAMTLTALPDAETELLVFNKTKWEFKKTPPNADFSLTNNPLVLTRARLPVLERQAAISKFKAYSNLKELGGGVVSNREFVYESQEVGAGEPVSPSTAQSNLVLPRSASQLPANAIERYLTSLLATVSESAPLNLTLQGRLCVPKGGGPRLIADPTKDVPDRYWYFLPLVLQPNVTLSNAAEVQAFARQAALDVVDALNDATIDLTPGQRRAISLDIKVRGGPFEKIGRVSLVELENAFVPI
jgi:hypothetical protein